MFNKSGNHVQLGSSTLICRMTEIRGDVFFSGSLEIEGMVTGNVVATDKDNAMLRVLQDGRVTGKIEAPLVIINGQVKGDVICGKHLELAAKAQVEGNVHYRYLEVVKGAQVNGKMAYLPSTENVDSTEADT